MIWLWRLVRRRQLERDLADEIEAHLGERADELVMDGLSRQEALVRARREFGNVTAIEERGRDVWRWATIENLWADVRYGARQLRGSPAFSLATILTLALGIGVNSAVFSVVDAVLLRPLPFPQPDRLVSVASRDIRGGPHPTDLSYPTFFDFRRDNRVFESMASFRDAELTLTGRGAALSLRAEIVSHEFFHVLGVPMAHGRGFLAAEERAGARVAVLSHQIWTTAFGQDPALVGQSVTVDGHPHQVVGITPAGFNFPFGRPVDVWTPLARDAAAGTDEAVTEQRGARMLGAIARLAPGVSLDQAQAGLDVVAGALARQYPDSNKNLATTYVRPALETIVASAWQPILMLWGAVGLVLLIACANVANMLLARTTDRERELGMRLAIGGSRARVIQQLLAENLLLAATGSGAGVLMALVTLRLVVVPFAAGHVPRIEAVGLDMRVLGFAVLLALLTAAACSVPPALRIWRVDFVAMVGGRSRGASDVHDRGRGLLVVAQIAIGLVLLSGAGVLVSGFIRLLNRDLGFEPRQLLTFQVGLPGARYSEDGRIAFIEQLVERLSSVPGVTSAAAAMPLPLEGDALGIAFDLEDRPSPPSQRPSSNLAIVTPGYFRTIGTTIVEGRDFARRDDEHAPGVAIVNQAFARRFFPGVRALGKRFEPGATDRRGSLMREIIGIVGNARQSPLGPEPEPIYYLPLRQMTWGLRTFLVRTTVPPMTLESSVRKVVASLDKDVPVDEVNAMEDLLVSSTSVPRFAVTLMSAFSIIAIVLIATGVYGLLTYAVLRRTRELGIRMALGATRRGVVALVLTRAAKLTTTGLLLGVVGSVAIARLFARVFPESAEPGAVLFPAAALIVMATALLAAFVPASRAAAIDPTEALRRE